MLVYLVGNNSKGYTVESRILSEHGFDCVCVENEEKISILLEQNIPELIIMDESDVFERNQILIRIKEKLKGVFVPVIYVSSEYNELERVNLFGLGVDDYIVKPFGILEFIMKIKVLTRRIDEKSAIRGEQLSYGNIIMYENSREVSVEKKKCELTYKEYELLKYLLQNKGIVLSREKMVEQVWGFDFQGESRTVDMHIKTLRQKLGENGKIIKTIRNVGYKLG